MHLEIPIEIDGRVLARIVKDVEIENDQRQILPVRLVGGW